jgi:hypothetical protein
LLEFWRKFYSPSLLFHSASGFLSSCLLCLSFFFPSGILLFVRLLFVSPVSSISPCASALSLSLSLCLYPHFRSPVVFVFIGKRTPLHLSELWSFSCWDNIHYWTVNGTLWGKEVATFSAISAESGWRRWTVCFETVPF